MIEGNVFLKPESYKGYTISFFKDSNGIVHAQIEDQSNVLKGFNKEEAFWKAKKRISEIERAWSIRHGEKKYYSLEEARKMLL